MDTAYKFNVSQSMPIAPSGKRSVPGYIGVMGFAQFEIANHILKLDVSPAGPCDKESNEAVRRFIDDLYTLLNKHGVALPDNPSLER